jgi:hypothetical protein
VRRRRRSMRREGYERIDVEKKQLREERIAREQKDKLRRKENSWEGAALEEGIAKKLKKRLTQKN